MTKKKQLFTISGIFLAVLVIAVIVLIILYNRDTVVDDTKGIHDISVSFAGDPKTVKGFLWYTEVSSKGTDIQYYKEGSADSFDNSGKAKGSYNTVKTKYPKNVSADEENPDLENIKLNCHRITLTGLEPGTKYVYRVGDASKKVWSDAGSFETAPESTDSVTFININDSQGTTEKDYRVVDFVLKMAFSKFPQTKFIVHTGDFVQDGKNNRQWEMFLDISQEFLMNSTLAPTMGNRDDNKMMDYFTLDSLGQSKGYYSYDYGDIHFTVLNTDDTSEAISDEQLNWMKNDISSSDRIWKIVVEHKALYANMNHVYEKDTVALRNQLCPVIEDLGVDLVIEGHDHYYCRSPVMKDGSKVDCETVSEVVDTKTVQFLKSPKGTVYLMAGTCGNNHYDSNDPIVKDDSILTDFVMQPSIPSFAALTVTKDKLTLQSYTVDKDTGKVTPIEYWGIVR